MAYDSKIIEIMIASPGDVADERQIVKNVVAEWNAIYARDRKVALMPVGWETHSSPELSDRPQQMINDCLLSHVDILVGIFWTRVGSPTGKSISGSIEEIEEHLKLKKPTMLYFSNTPVALDSVDITQYEQLNVFKAWAKEQGLVEFFDGRDDFRNKFQRQLPIALRDNSYLKRILVDSQIDEFVDAFNVALSPQGRKSLSEDARELLSAGAADSNGLIMVLRYIGGTTIQANESSFGEADNRRSVARWEAAVDELKERGFVRDMNGKGEMFEVTDAGYRLIETSS